MTQLESNLPVNLGEIQLLITDWSGVISDDRQIVYEANKIMVKSRGLEMPSFEDWLKLSKASCADFLESLGLTINRDEIGREYAQMLANLRKEGHRPTVYPDAHMFFERVAVPDRYIVVLSTHPEKHLSQEIEEYGLGDHIDNFIGASPDKTEHILALMGQMEVRCQQVAYMGDMESDMRYGRRARVPTIGVASGYHSRERLEAEGPHLVVNSLTELLKHFR